MAQQLTERHHTEWARMRKQEGVGATEFIDAIRTVETRLPGQYCTLSEKSKTAVAFCCIINIILQADTPSLQRDRSALQHKLAWRS